MIYGERYKRRWTKSLEETEVDIRDRKDTGNHYQTCAVLLLRVRVCMFQLISFVIIREGVKAETGEKKWGGGMTWRSTQFGPFRVRAAVRHLRQMVAAAAVPARFLRWRQGGRDADVQRARRAAWRWRDGSRTGVVLFFGALRQIEEFAHDGDGCLTSGHGHPVLHKVEHVLVVQEPDQVERTERSGAPQSQIANHHRAESKAIIKNIILWRG